MPFRKGSGPEKPQGNIRQAGHILRGEYMQAFFASVLQMTLKELLLEALAQLVLELESALQQGQGLPLLLQQLVAQ